MFTLFLLLISIVYNKILYYLLTKIFKYKLNFIIENKFFIKLTITYSIKFGSF